VPATATVSGRDRWGSSGLSLRSNRSEIGFEPGSIRIRPKTKGVRGNAFVRFSSGAMDALRHQLNRRSQAFLDRLAPHTIGRWLASVLVVAVYVWRVSRLHGFYIVTYGLGIYNLNLLIGFLTPQTDPDSDEPALPTKSDEEFKPFVRRLPEFKFWCVAKKGDTDAKARRGLNVSTRDDGEVNQRLCKHVPWNEWEAMQPCMRFCVVAKFMQDATRMVRGTDPV